MSDISRGEGWWQASDHKWYPPEQHPDFQAPTEPLAPAPEDPAPAVVTPPPAAPAKTSSRWIVAVGVLAAAALALGAVLLFGRDDGKKSVAAASSTSPSTSSTSSSSSSVALTEAELRTRLITAKDLGTGFTDGSFVRSTAVTTPCGTQNPDRSIPPSIDVGSTAKTATGISFQQEIAVYDDEAIANRAFDLDVGAYSCPRGTILNSSNSSSDSLVFEPTRDHASLFDVDKAVEVDFRSDGFHGQLFFARTNATVVLIAFIWLDTADTSGTRSSLLVTREALDRLA
jgi:hypothetical protein